MLASSVMSFDSRRVQEAIRAAAIAHPGSHEQRPWNPPAFTVYKKALVFVGGPGGRVSMSLKLSESHDAPLCEPTGCGLGKSRRERDRPFTPKTAVKKQLGCEEQPSTVIAALEALSS